MPRTNLCLIKGFLCIYRKRLFKVELLFSTKQNTKFASIAKIVGLNTSLFYSEHQSGGFLINATVASIDTRVAGLGQSSGQAADDKWGSLIQLQP